MARGATAAAIAEAVRSVIMAKTMDHLHGHPETENVDHLESKIVKDCAAIRATAWGGHHICLPLSFPDAALSRVIVGALANCNLSDPRKVNNAIKPETPTFDQLALKADQDILWIELWTQLAVTDLAVKLIISCVDAQYIKELEEDYIGYANCTIRGLLCHLRTTWCKINNQEKVDAKVTLRNPWADTPYRHITKYTRELTRSADAAIAIGIP